MDMIVNTVKKLIVGDIVQKLDFDLCRKNVQGGSVSRI